MPCGTALFAFVREGHAHGITPLGELDSLNSGGPEAEPPLRTDHLHQQAGSGESFKLASICSLLESSMKNGL